MTLPEMIISPKVRIMVSGKYCHPNCRFLQLPDDTWDCMLFEDMPKRKDGRFIRVAKCLKATETAGYNIKWAKNK